MAGKKKPDPFRQNVEEFDGYAPAVVFNTEGQSLFGTVLSYSEGNSADFGSYPICVVEDEDTGEAVSIHLFHAALLSQFSNQRPLVGERIAVKYMGKHPNKAKTFDYHHFLLRVDRSAPETPEGEQAPDGVPDFSEALESRLGSAKRDDLD